MVLPANAAATVLDAYNYALEEKKSEYRYAPYVLKDDKGEFTLQEKDNGVFRRNNYYKNYIVREDDKHAGVTGEGLQKRDGSSSSSKEAGKAESDGQPSTDRRSVVEIDKEEFRKLKKEAEAVEGTTDWKGDFVPGLQRRQLEQECNLCT